MKSTNLKFPAAVGASFLMLGYAQAQSQFAFTFTGNDTGPYYISGTVAGIITLNAGQSAATSILITSAPPGDANEVGIDFVTDPHATVYLNSFAVTDGNISDAQFDSDLWSGPVGGELSMGYNDLLSGSGGEVDNLDHVPGITFTPEATPEPATLALAALGAGALLKLRRRK